NVALAALVAVCHAHGEALNLDLQLSITETLCQIWTALTVEQVLSQHCLQQTAALLLSLVALLIRVVGPTLIAQGLFGLSRSYYWEIMATAMGSMEETVMLVHGCYQKMCETGRILQTSTSRMMGKAKDRILI
ncbi:hypothetical protein scyTo_0023145, partial [Scyliorhinus torazame]|nr:hypothetical protein [Scyliorhinus torazame]